MRRLTVLSFVVLALLAFSSGSFKDDQKKYPRVRQAYAEKEQAVKDLLKTHEIKINELRVYLRAFKKEKKIELWAKNNSDEAYQFIREYSVCRTSGEIGPKRKKGDLQIPEGFYHIDRFNPSSNFHLSLGINYPNTSDKIMGVKGSLGGDIFIHGACVTIGCLPVTDDQIKELYVFCVEAKDNGQGKIPITIFPSELTTANYNVLKTTYGNDSDKLGLWADLKAGYDLFNENKKVPQINFLNNGRHQLME